MNLKKLFSVLMLSAKYDAAIPNYSQQDATFFFFFLLTLLVSGGSSAHHQEQVTGTYSFRYCQPILMLVASMEESFISFKHYFLTIPKTVCTVMCS
jgi:hypothetical protein